MKRKPAIELLTDNQIAEKLVQNLESMDYMLDNMAVFDNINSKSREALHISIKKAASCARNVRREL